MAAECYRVLRFTNAAVLGDVEGVVAVIREEVDRRRGSQPAPELPLQAGDVGPYPGFARQI
jgi:hypothetical protein